ncbi:MAG: M3 family metallopeptidase [Rhizobiaceae bacterium]
MPAINLSRHALTHWDAALGLPDFHKIRTDDFGPVFDAALAAHAAEIEAIAANPEPPTLENTLAALELAGEALSHVSAVFWCLAGAHTSEEIQALEREFAPKLSRHFTAIIMNAPLFARIKALHAAAPATDAETARVLDRTFKRFVRSGANLGPAQKTRLAEINERLSVLGARFGQNVLADEQNWALLLDAADLAGIPDFLAASMAAAAASRGAPGRFAVTLSRSVMEPFLAFSTRRDLREQAFSAFIARGETPGETDNRPVVMETLVLRTEKAALLGFSTFADWKLDDTMAKTPQAVMDLLSPVWEKARARALEDESELARLAAAEGGNHAIAPWDWRHFAEKLRSERFAFDEAALKPYLSLERIIAACFDVASRLFGLSFTERKDVAGWHDDVRTFEVRDPDGSLRAIFLADYFARPSKRSGAWMSALQSARKLASPLAPIIYNIMNFAKPAEGQPALLSLDEARTLFHEFGHALHGMLSDVTWPSLSGTAVSRDFVELPSQLFEHWLTVPEILEKHARHHVTGEPMPQVLMDKLKAARTFGAGFATVEFTASALVDMAFHSRTDAPQDVAAFEAETLASLGMPASIAMRHRTPHFSHVFSGDGYSAGYYSYLWSEVLDADAFAAFEETGDAFHPETAEKLRRHIYAAGNSADPEALYTAFRGRMPTPQAMMEKRGLA